MRVVEIVGGGVCGLGLGVGLRGRGVPVVVREAGTYPRHKVCGEFLNGVTFETLRALGIEEVFSDALRHWKTRWWVGGREVLSRRLRRPALGISRFEMDDRLAALFVKKGGVLRTQERVRREAAEGRVWTAGRRLEKGSALVGLKAHFSGIEVCGLEMHLGRGGYLGLAPVKEGVNVAGLFSKQDGVKVAWQPLLEEVGLGELAERLATGEMEKGSLSGVAALQLGTQKREIGLCVLGDADRMIPPVTGNGMSMALEAAECALEPLERWSRGEVEWAGARRVIATRLDRRFWRRMWLAQGLHQLLTNRLGQPMLTAAAVSGAVPFDRLHRELVGA